MSNAYQVWGERLSSECMYYHASTWCVHCKILLSGRVASPTNIAKMQSLWQTSLLDRFECMSSLRGEITGLCGIIDVTGMVSHIVVVHLWVASSLTCESPRRWHVYHCESLYVVLEPLNGVLPILICKMTKWCSKFELWTEICRHMHQTAQSHLLFPINVQLFVSELTTKLLKTENWKYSSPPTGFWQWENDGMCLVVVNLLFLTALFWGATASNCQGCCFVMQGAALSCSKNWISGKRDSFQERLCSRPVLT